MSDIRDFYRQEQERRILNLLTSGELEIATGKGHDLDSVLAEADAALVEPTS